MAQPRRFAFFALTLASLGLAGCGDMMTFSHVSREQGVKALNAGDYDAAEGAFSDAIRQNPRDYTSYSYLGQLYERKGEHAKALAAFKTSLDTMPLTTQGQADDGFRVRTLTAQADTLAEVQDGDAALDAMEAKSAGSTTGEESYQLARIFAGRGDADSAVAAYNRAASQAPDQFYIAKAQGLYLAKQGQKAEAEQALRRAYRLGTTDDDEVNAGLRSLGVVPGPSLKDPDQLQKPILPVGPIPDYLHPDKSPPARP